MTDEDVKIPSYKPLSKRSKFNKPNQQGQVPKDCIYFNFCGKHCWDGGLGDYNDVATDCVVLKGEYCSKYQG